MPKLQGIDEIRALEKYYHFKFDRSLGQNFLNDRSVLEDIASGCNAGKDDLVLEIGPGMGFLTMALAEKAGKVLAIEIDERLIPILEKNLAFYNNVKVINADVLKIDLKALIRENSILPNGNAAKGLKIVGNLPYYITTPILTKILDEELWADTLTVMVQKEVSDRILARPGKPEYCVLSLLLGYYGKAELLRDVEAALFVPRPKVDSAVLRLNIIKGGSVEVKDKTLLFKVIKAGFGQRRKTLLNALCGGGFLKERVKKALAEAAIDEKRRAETLSLEEFAKLADAIFIGDNI